MNNGLGSKRIWSGIILASSLFWQIPGAWADNARTAVGQIIATIGDTTSPSQLDSRLNNQVDYAAITQMTFTPAQWSHFTPAQREQLQTSYRQLISKRYYRRWHRLFAKSTISYGDTSQSGGDTYLKTFVKHGKQADLVTWRLRQNNQRLALIDINANDKGLIARLSKRSQAELKRRGTERFLAWIKKVAGQGQEVADSSGRSSQNL